MGGDPIRSFAPGQADGRRGDRLPLARSLVPGLVGSLGLALATAATLASLLSPLEAGYLVVLAGPAAICALRALRSSGASAAAWWLFAGALVVLWAHEAPWLSGASDAVGSGSAVDEGLAGAFYLLALLAIATLVRAERLRRTPLLDALICLFGLGTAWSWLGYGALSGVDAARQADLAPLIARPLLSLLIAVLVLGVILRNGWRVGPAWPALLVAFGSLVAADGAHLATAEGASGSLTAAADGFTMAAAAAFAAAAWLPAGRTGAGSSQSISIHLVAAAGLLAIACLVVDHFSRVPDATAILAGLTLIVAVARGSILYARQARAERRARDVGLQAVRALAATVDAKDRYTRDHSERVTAYSAAIALKLGFDIDRVENLIDAGRLHDVGKIAVPDSVLLKPGALTEIEFAQIKRHSVEGERIVREVGRPELARWIRHHHERWDGRGYPDGLRGAEAPLEARIIAVADAFDAMTSDRSYRPRLSVEDAVGELEAGAGAQFDPECARVLADLIREGIVVVEGGGLNYRVRETANGHLDGEGYQRLGQALLPGGPIGAAVGVGPGATTPIRVDLPSG